MNWEIESPEQAALAAAGKSAARYLAEIQERRVAPEEEAVRALCRLSGDLPETGDSLDAILADLTACAAPATVANVGPRFFGFVNGGALPASVCASWLAAAWDQNAALQAMSPAAAELERVALEWARELLQLPAGCAGALVTGATMASLAGLAAARHALLADLGWDVEADGLRNAPELRVVVSDEAHASMLKAVAILGLGRSRVERVPVDSQGRMRPSELPPLDERSILCVQAGNVNTGAFDPADELCAAAKAARAWVHVDGAFGLWASASPQYRRLTRGYESADSWATDGHKWPNVGYDCGIAFVRRPEALRSAMRITAAYLPSGERRDPMEFTPECSRRARGFELWAALRSLGRTGMADLVERCCRHAEHFAGGLAADGHRILNHVVLNQVLVSFGTPERTREVIRAIQEEGTCWAGPTQWQGETAMRISVSSWATTERDVDLSLAAIRRIVAAV